MNLVLSFLILNVDTNFCSKFQCNPYGELPSEIINIIASCLMWYADVDKFTHVKSVNFGNNWLEGLH